MRIEDHAVDRYIKRVLGIPVGMAGESVREYAERQIRDAAHWPEVTYKGKEDMPPVYIKGDVAVPVDRTIAPTVYEARTFRRKIDG